jgi:trehalose 6-phosphate phosphatase
MSRSWRQAFSLIFIFGSVACVENIHRLNEIMEVTYDDLDNYFSQYFNEDKFNFVLLLDYDGTLAPIAAHPNLTVMSDATSQALESISRNNKIFTAVISGRGVDDAKKKVNIENLIYAGNHGLEILYPNGTRYDS